MLVRQDKIGYEDKEIITMVREGLMKLCKTIDSWPRYKKYKIDLIYTLAWSRKKKYGDK